MIKVITNSNGSGDWVRIIDSNNELVHDAHRITPFDLVMILQNLGIQAELVEVNDEQMEEM
jgi:hypothetical protein